MMLNGKRLNAFPPRPRTRQGYLSLLLSFNIIRGGGGGGRRVKVMAYLSSLPVFPNNKSQHLDLQLTSRQVRPQGYSTKAPPLVSRLPRWQHFSLRSLSLASPTRFHFLEINFPSTLIIGFKPSLHPFVLLKLKSFPSYHQSSPS